jgi:hypothetical protein
VIYRQKAHLKSTKCGPQATGFFEWYEMQVSYSAVLSLPAYESFPYNAFKFKGLHLSGLNDSGVKMDASMISANLAVFTTVSGHPC